MFTLYGKKLPFNDLIKIKVKDVEKIGKEYSVRYPSRNNEQKTFRIDSAHSNLIDQYVKLRSEISQVQDRFFLNYKKMELSCVPMGKNKFQVLPQRIAKYLNLPNAELYFSSSFSLCNSVVFSVKRSGNRIVKLILST